VSHEFVNNLQTQLRESVAQMEGLEKERDFYFTKVRHGLASIMLDALSN
jgi:hypothetical protein